MKLKIFGWVGVVWGGLVVLSGLAKLASDDMGDGAYGAGQFAGFIFGGLLCLAGIYTLRKKPKT